MGSSFLTFYVNITYEVDLSNGTKLIMTRQSVATSYLAPSSIIVVTQGNEQSLVQGNKNDHT